MPGCGVAFFIFGGQMDITKVLSTLKNESNFKENVGMILIHNGVVRGISRNGKKVKKLLVKSDNKKIEQIRKKYESKNGIFKIVIEPRSGEFEPGDDLLWIIVAGDVRENVKEVLSSVLDEVKSLAVEKKEILDD